MDGINEGVRKFNVPMVGGHVHPDAPYNSLDVAITGVMNRDDLITSCGARPGHKVLVAMDLDGRVHPQFKLNWDTTTMKTAELVQAQIQCMNEIARKHLLSAGKDISNPGTLGTLGMLLEASNVGATVELERIPRNNNVNWEDWLRLYPGAGFVLTAEEDNVEKIIELLENVNITTQVVGSVLSDKKLYLTSDDDKEIVFDFYTDKIMGIQEEIS
jgi:selenophosphate synthetase-related protein